MAPRCIKACIHLSSICLHSLRLNQKTVLVSPSEDDLLAGEVGREVLKTLAGSSCRQCSNFTGF